jgi:ABC-type sugar transport system substrate-binding protein
VAFGSGLPPEAEQAIASGALQAWIAQRPWSFGFKGVQAAVDLAGGKTLSATVDVDYLVVTKENLASAEAQALKN